LAEVFLELLYLETYGARGQTDVLRSGGETSSPEDRVECAQERDLHKFSSSVVQQKVAFLDRSTRPLSSKGRDRRDGYLAARVEQRIVAASDNATHPSVGK
jgi:hypothetical protein